MSDDGFHEIQLNGKQLVFLFMAAAVVGVVMFLCGVMVGRGVRAEKAAGVLGDVAPSRAGCDDASGRARRHGSGGAGDLRRVAAATGAAAPPATPPPPVNDELSYYDRLEKPAAAAAEKPTVPAEPPAARAAAPPAPRAGQAGERHGEDLAKPAPSATSASQAGSTGYSVQVIAMRERSASEAIAKRLAGKGYNAYVLDPAPGSRSTLYRVRVGPYKTRREAEDARLPPRERRAVQTMDYALALLSGVLLALSFPRFGHPSLAWIALLPLLVALAGVSPLGGGRRPVSTRRAVLPRPHGGRRCTSPARCTGFPG